MPEGVTNGRMIVFYRAQAKPQQPAARNSELARQNKPVVLAGNSAAPKPRECLRRCDVGVQHVDPAGAEPLQRERRRRARAARTCLLYTSDAADE